MTSMYGLRRSVGTILFATLLGLFAGLDSVCAAEDQLVCFDRVQLQDETVGYLEELDNLYLDSNTLFSDQGEANLCAYAKHYHKAKKLVEDLKNSLDCWKQLIEQNGHDKVYRTYAASVQLALYSIYARGNEFLMFLRFEKKLNEFKDRPCLTKIFPQDDLQEGFDLTIDEWEQNAESYLMRANETIKRALIIDDNYKDARILEAQWLALRGNYDDAIKKFDALEDEGWFRDQRSFPNSWKAYIAIRQQENVKESATPPEGGEDRFLKKASAYSEPLENSKWASRYMKKKRLAKMEEVSFTFADSFPVENVDLEKLQEKMVFLIEIMREELNASLEDAEGIPKPISKGSSVASMAKDRTKVLISLETDTSKRNLSRYAKILENIYTAGKKLEEVIEKWNSLASQNMHSADYYNLNKSACSLAFLEVIECTFPHAKNVDLKNVLEKRQKERQEQQEEKGEIIDYEAQWDEWWNKYTASTVSDIEKMAAGNSAFLPVKMLQFEYAATLNEPAKALSSLEALQPQLKKYKFTTFSEKGDVDPRAYVAAWNSYLAFEGQNLKAAKKFLTEAKGYKGLSEWKKNQEKRLYIEDKLSQKDYLK